MRFMDAGTFTADRPWGSLDLGEFDPAPEARILVVERRNSV
ncbi:hypothetical protein AALF15_11365 [Corynebacteriaceae bacterium 7-707]